MRSLALGALIAFGLAGCGGAEAPQESAVEPVPALSRAGAKWQVTRGDRRVFSINNEPGIIRWTKSEDKHPFASGAIADPREEARLRQIVKQSRHFRDLIHRLERAGYGVASADAPAGG